MRPQSMERGKESFGIYNTETKWRMFNNHYYST
jgi:hypothetical protein